MGTTNIHFIYRPIRVGYLVDHGSMTQLLDAVEAATCTWGGMLQPIIPVAEDPADALKAIDRMRVEVLAPMSNSAAVTRVANERKRLRLDRHYNMAGPWYVDPPDQTKSLAFLDVAPALSRLGAGLKQIGDGSSRRFAAMPGVAPGDPLAAALAVHFGRFPSSPEMVVDYADLFLSYAQASHVDIALGGTISADMLEDWSPIQASRYALTVPRHRPPMGLNLYVGDHDSFDDLVIFWNLRAGGFDIEFISGQAVDRYAPMLGALTTRFRAQPGMTGTFEPHISLHGGDAAEAVSERIKALIGDFGRTAVIPKMSNEALAAYPPLDAIIMRDEAIGHSDAGGSVLTVVLPTSPAAGTAAGDVRRQHLVVEFDQPGLEPGVTLKPPYLPALSEFYSREISFSPYALRSTERGLAVLASVSEKALRLRPISHRKVIEAVLGLAGLRVKSSRAGTMTDRIIERFGGLDETRIFKVRGVRRLLDEFGTTDAVTFGTATERIHNGGQFSEHDDVYLDGHPLTTKACFKHLLEHDVFRAGLALKCEQCELKSWLPLPRILDMWECEFCGRSNRTSTQLTDRGDWRFRRSGMFARTDSQEGAIPVILALATLQRCIGSLLSGFTYATSLLLEGDGIEMEVDFVGLTTADDGGVEVVLGEAKSQGGEVDDNDVANLSRLAEILGARGLRGVLAFAKTAADFTSSEKARIRTLRTDDVPTILFTNRELEKYFPYVRRGEQRDVPFEHPMTSAELVANSDVRHLSP